MALHPVGPLPASTYWRRRLVLFGVLVVLLLLARSCVGGHARPPAAAPRPLPSPSPTGRPTQTPAHVGLSTCPDSVLTLTAATDSTDYPHGTSPRFTLTVKNTSGTACRRDLGAAAVELLVYSGPDRIWSSDDCSTDTSHATQVLAPGQVLQTSVQWAGKRSARGCPTPHPEAQPGTYTVRGRLGTLHSTVAVFRLR